MTLFSFLHIRSASFSLVYSLPPSFIVSYSCLNAPVLFFILTFVTLFKGALRMFYHLSSLGCVFPHFFISPQGCPQGARFSSFLSSPPVGSSPWQPLVETHAPRTQDFHWIDPGPLWPALPGLGVAMGVTLPRGDSSYSGFFPLLPLLWPLPRWQ